MKKTLWLILKSNWPAFGIISCSLIIPLLGLGLVEKEDTPNLLPQVATLILFIFIVIYASCFKELDLGAISDLLCILASAVIMMVFSIIFPLRILLVVSVILGIPTSLGLIVMLLKSNAQKKSLRNERVSEEKTNPA